MMSCKLKLGATTGPLSSKMLSFVYFVTATGDKSKTAAYGGVKQDETQIQYTVYLLLLCPL